MNRIADDPQWQAIVADHAAQNRRDRVLLMGMVLMLAIALPVMPWLVVLVGPADIYMAVGLLRGWNHMEQLLKRGRDMDSTFAALREAGL